MNLSTLAIGSLVLTPAFDKNVTVYTATTENASNKVTAVAEDTAADISITNGSTEVKNGTATTWTEGENDLKVIVQNGGKSKTYIVTVTKE